MPPKPGEDNSYFPFQKLPPEIRNMIYKELVVVGKVFLTPSNDNEPYRLEYYHGGRYHHMEHFRKPELQLFRVCKQFRGEAEPLYLAKNLFVLPVDWHQCKPVARDSTMAMSQDRHLFPDSGLRHIRNISIAVDQRLCKQSPQLDKEWWDSYYVVHRSPFDGMTEAQRLRAYHQKECKLTSYEWTEMINSLTVFSEIKYIEIDFTNAFCAAAICRPVQLIIGEWIKHLAPRRIDVIGMRRNERAAFIVEAFARAGITHEDLRATYGLRFRRLTDTTPWDAMKREPEMREPPVPYDSRRRNAVTALSWDSTAPPAPSFSPLTMATWCG